MTEYFRQRKHKRSLAGKTMWSYTQYIIIIKVKTKHRKKKVFLKVAKDTSAQNMAFKQITSILSAKNENWKTEE